MVDVMGSGALVLVLLAIALVAVVIGLSAGFIVYRTGLHAGEQLELLEALLDQQKRQNALLRRLCEANEPEREKPAEPVQKKAAPVDDGDDFIRLVAER